MSDTSTEGTPDLAAIQAQAQAAEQRAQAAEQRAAEIEAQQRADQVRATLVELNAPGIDPSLFPADQPVTREAMQSFLRDKIGLAPDANEAWQRYEQASSGRTPPPAPRDEDAVWAETEMAKTARFYQRQNAPTPDEVRDLEDLKAKLFPKMNEWDQRVSEGRMDVLIEPGGFGGLTDPPPWARRARHHIASSTQ